MDATEYLLDRISAKDVERLFASDGERLHRKVDATRDAYFGYIFPITREDLRTVSSALGFSDEAIRALYKHGTEFSTFRRKDSGSPQLTNHIFGSAMLALRGRSLDTGLSSVTDKNIETFIHQHERTVREIAEIRSSWFGRIYFPANAFANAITVFGGQVSPDALYQVADKYGYAATAGARKTIRGDFGIGVWLTLLGLAP